MIDQDQLHQAYTKMRQICLQMAVSPLALLLLAWWVARESSGSSGGPGSGEMATPTLVVFAVLALLPTAAVPLVRALLRRRISAGRHDIQQILQTYIPTETFIVYGMFSATGMLGFVAFFAGGPWWLYLVAFGLSYVGLLADFPRWSTWVRRAEELELKAAVQSIPAPL